jgi:MtfA peptidase
VLGAIRRWRAARRPFPERWRDILARDVPFYARLSAADRERLEHKLKVFARTKHFAGAGGMEIDDRVKVVIAASAARLVLNLASEHYSRLKEIVVYPDAYQHPDRDGVILGEVNSFGTMVLSWQAVLDGLANTDDGKNTAFHEFAHALDLADGNFNGTPVLATRCAYAPWAQVMTRYYDKLQEGRRKPRVLDEYGATNEAEFFAVATEAFFEKPRQLRSKKPELYELLADYYQTDPAAELERWLDLDTAAS